VVNNALEATKAPKAAGIPAQPDARPISAFDDSRTAAGALGDRRVCEKARSAASADTRSRSCKNFVAMPTTRRSPAQSTACFDRRRVEDHHRALCSDERTNCRRSHATRPCRWRRNGRVVDKLVQVAKQQAETASATAVVDRSDGRTSQYGHWGLRRAGPDWLGPVRPLSIAKPIRRIAEVLLELGNGNKRSMFLRWPWRRGRRCRQCRPTSSRRPDPIEKWKRAEGGGASRRRAAQGRHAQASDDFQAAVGEIIATVSSASTELEPPPHP